jgi:hypothetical protein
MVEPRDQTYSKHMEWLRAMSPLHERLTVGVTSLLENMMRKTKIEYLGIVIVTLRQPMNRRTSPPLQSS